MYTHILISTDGSELSQRGVDHGLSLAKSLKAKVTVVTVTEPFPFQANVIDAMWMPTDADIASYEEGQKANATAILAAVDKSAKKVGVTAVTRHIADAWPAEAIVEMAHRDGCNLIVMASHGRRGLGRLFLGSQTAHVLAQSGVPVLVVK